MSAHARNVVWMTVGIVLCCLAVVAVGVVDLPVIAGLAVVLAAMVGGIVFGVGVERDS